MTSLLIADDDKTFCATLASALTRRGYEVQIAHDINSAIRAANDFDPEYAVVDLKMQHESGLALIPKLLDAEPYMKIIVLTGYASVNTAIEAIKLGAIHYLAKPADTDEIITAFQKTTGNPDAPITPAPTISQLERDHLLATLARNHNNISATARELKMHRRTLQRKLDKIK